MNSDISQVKQKTLICSYIGHEDEEIIGFCLLLNCQKPASFCLKCITNDISKIHSGHLNKYCVGFKNIVYFLQKEIQQQLEMEKEYQILHLLFINFISQVQKNFNYKQKQIISKLQNTMQKCEIIFQKLIQRKQKLEILVITFQQQTFENFTSDLNIVKKYFCAQLDQKIFSRISRILEEKKKNTLDQMLQRNISKTIIKAAQIYFERGIKLQQTGKLHEALKYLEQSINRYQSYSKVYYYKGKILDDLNNYQEAIKCYDEAIKLDPLNLFIYLNKGDSLYNLGKFEEANECFDAVIKMDLTNKSAQRKKGNALYNLGKYQEAILCYDEVIRLSPTSQSAYKNKGNALYNLDKYEEAIKCYDQIIRLDSKNQSAYNNKGNVLDEIGKYDDAICCYDEIIRLDPMNQLAYNNKAKALSKLNKYEDAIKCYDEIIILNSKNYSAYNSKGDALKQLGKYEDAIRCYDEAMRLNQNYKLAQQNHKLTLLQVDNITHTKYIQNIEKAIQQQSDS